MAFGLLTTAVHVVLAPMATEEGWHETKNPGWVVLVPVVEDCPTFRVNVTERVTPPPLPVTFTW
jgi:hypothetical protein